MSDHNQEQPRLPLSPEQGQPQELALEESEPGPQEDAGREVQVLKAVGDYFARKRRRR